MPTHCDHRQCPIKADPTILGFRLWFSFPRISGRCISDLGEQKGCSRRDPRSVMCVSDLGEQKGCSRRDPRSVMYVSQISVNKKAVLGEIQEVWCVCLRCNVMWCDFTLWSLLSLNSWSKNVCIISYVQMPRLMHQLGGKHRCTENLLVMSLHT